MAFAKKAFDEVTAQQLQTKASVKKPSKRLLSSSFDKASVKKPSTRLLYSSFKTNAAVEKLSTSLLPQGSCQTKASVKKPSFHGTVQHQNFVSLLFQSCCQALEY